MIMGSNVKFVSIGFPSSAFGVKEGPLADTATGNPLKISVMSFYTILKMDG